ncbi:folate-binding protein [Lysobacter sp. GX 14042]|uniref:CAF17-like 4Fe-4S cluster assembly/insertion protein YgfZ n=1 Tax=Lysobacter sp. GX 14042 TaxID=2907155 RepID=UPI001F1E982C|nr:folate-binding protein [Lysobacter sp. GX 14042]MCE7031517.1 folate-binding protein [Lysobacter sp. GX 14042]
MQDKSPQPSQPLFALPAHRVLQLSGPDAAKFAQAQFMSDVAGLADGQWHWSGWLTPKGRVVALFALLRLEEGLFWLLLPDADAGALAEQLRRFVFRSKLKIEPLADARVHGRLGPAEQAGGNRLARLADGGVELDMGGDGGRRALYVALDPGSSPGPNADAAAAWTLADLQHGLPRLAWGTPQWTPQQLSLERLDAFTVRKGCYPGQEIVARTHFLGKAKRRLVLLEGGAALSIGDPVSADDAPAGELVSSVPVPGGGRTALAVVQATDAAPGYAVRGSPVRTGELLGGLAR